MFRNIKRQVYSEIRKTVDITNPKFSLFEGGNFNTYLIKFPVFFLFCPKQSNNAP